MITNLSRLLLPALSDGHGVMAFNVYGYEDAYAVVDAAEQLGAPVTLSASMTLLRFIPLPVVAFMLTHMAKQVSVPVCIHLDHCSDIDFICQAVDCGFTSVMYDGSELPLQDNIANIQRVVEYTRPRGVSVEAGLGIVPDDKGGTSARLTCADDAQTLVERCDIDALAVSIGNQHHQKTQNTKIDFARMESIQRSVDIPLVMHGSSGIPDAELKRLATSSLCKFNLGTALRRSFGGALRRAFDEDPGIFDRIQLMRITMDDVRKEAQHYIRLVG